MQAVARFVSLAVLLALVVFAAGCGSNNKGKIEGRWKYVSFGENPSQDEKALLEDLAKESSYLYVEFHADGTLSMGFGSDKPDKVDQLKKQAEKQEQPLVLQAKYRLLTGNEVEVYDIPPEMRDKDGPFGDKDHAKMKVEITGDTMKMSDRTSSATLERIH